MTHLERKTTSSKLSKIQRLEHVFLMFGSKFKSTNHHQCHHVILRHLRLMSPLRLRAGTILPSLPMQNDLKASQLPPFAICHRLEVWYWNKNHRKKTGKNKKLVYVRFSKIHINVSVIYIMINHHI